ncbi:MAG TPA: hypothetical protein VEO53_14550, partial [Candidatus Binatia bacterium]|nr:hypothetical protein [Candidatus Binatia bacterium]
HRERHIRRNPAPLSRRARLPPFAQWAVIAAMGEATASLASAWQHIRAGCTDLIPTGQGATLVSFKQKMIDAMVSSSDGVAVAASAGKFPEGGPTRYQAAFETAARS